jgi:hypothetical protein
MQQPDSTSLKRILNLSLLRESSKTAKMPPGDALHIPFETES